MSRSIILREVRYIKLGESGIWEEECTKDGTIRFGFWTGKPERLRLCRDGDWEGLRRIFLKDGNDKTRARNFTNQIKAFFEDDGSTLWITFHGDHMYWGFLDQGPPEADSGSTYRDVVNGWSRHDLSGTVLTKSQLDEIRQVSRHIMQFEKASR